MNAKSKRIQALQKLGDHLRDYDPKKKEYDSLTEVVQKAIIFNGWFTFESIQYCFSSWAKALTTSSIEKWLSSYFITEKKQPKTVALILAGNIPLVGFHDLICVWVSGHQGLVKCANKDSILLPYMTQFLEHDSGEKRFTYTQEVVTNFDAVIATGSNNAARYFDHYFSNYPHIIRKNRNGIAVLKGSESKKELEALGKDILQYFGLGCRNVSKLYLPKDYDLDLIFGGLFPYSFVIDHAKYANNYDYNKAVFLMSEFDFLENGFVMLKEDSHFSAPISCVHYEFYEDQKTLKKHLNENKNAIQCIVASDFTHDCIPFGEAQHPALWDYADQIDTLKFLEDLMV